SCEHSNRCRSCLRGIREKITKLLPRRPSDRTTEILRREHSVLEPLDNYSFFKRAGLLIVAVDKEGHCFRSISHDRAIRVGPAVAEELPRIPHLADLIHIEI